MQAVIDATGQKDDIVQPCFILQGVVDGVSTCNPPQEMRLRVIMGGAGTALVIGLGALAMLVNW